MTGWSNRSMYRRLYMGEITLEPTEISKRSPKLWPLRKEYIDQIDEDDFENLWRDYDTRSKQVYKGLTFDGWCGPG
jgi:hypothetical protein